MKRIFNNIVRKDYSSWNCWGLESETGDVFVTFKDERKEKFDSRLKALEYIKERLIEEENNANERYRDTYFAEVYGTDKEFRELKKEELGEEAPGDEDDDAWENLKEEALEDCKYIKLNDEELKDINRAIEREKRDAKNKLFIVHDIIVEEGNKLIRLEDYSLSVKCDSVEEVPQKLQEMFPDQNIAFYSVD